MQQSFKEIHKILQVQIVNEALTDGRVDIQMAFLVLRLCCVTR